MQHKVPQNVDRDDEILPYLTVKQLFILSGGAFLAFAAFSTISNMGLPFEISMAVAAVPMGLSFGIGYINYGGVTFLKFLLLFLESQFRPQKRIWRHAQDFEQEMKALSSMTQAVSSSKTQEKEEKKMKTLDDFLIEVRANEQRLRVDTSIDEELEDDEKEHLERINQLNNGK